jgi:hypothetical protein
MRDAEAEALQVGRYIKAAHDTVAFGVEPFYSRILKINRVTVRVKTENGDNVLVTKEFARQHLLGDSEWHPEIASEVGSQNNERDKIEH